MLKIRLLTVIFLVIFLLSCTNSKNKTEIKVQLSEAEYLFSLPGYEKDTTFLNAYHFAQKEFNPEKEEFLSLFEKRLLELDPDCKLASYFGTIEFKDKITYESTNPEVVAVLTEAIKSAMENTIRVLKKRIESACRTTSFPTDLFDKPSVEVKVLPMKNNYSFIVNRKVDKAGITKLLESQGDFGLWETYYSREVWDNIVRANKLIREKFHVGSDVNTGIANIRIDKENPLFSILVPSSPIDSTATKGDIIGASSVKDTAQVHKYLAFPEVIDSMPRNIKFIWELKHADKNRDSAELIAVRITTRDGSAVLNGNCIINAEEKTSKRQATVIIKLNPEGAKILSRMTGENINKQIALVIDNTVWFNPYINLEITGGTLNISGNISSEEANYLASLLNGGTKPKISVKVIDIYETIE
jgi:SecD/SecF fusion protein